MSISLGREKCSESADNPRGFDLWLREHHVRDRRNRSEAYKEEIGARHHGLLTSPQPQRTPCGCVQLARG